MRGLKDASKYGLGWSRAVSCAQVIMKGQAMGNQWSALTADDGWTLGEVKWHWGNAYAVMRSLGSYVARRRDGIGKVLVAADPDGLVSLIRSDYGARPVSR